MRGRIDLDKISIYKQGFQAILLAVVELLCLVKSGMETLAVAAVAHFLTELNRYLYIQTFLGHILP